MAGALADNIANGLLGRTRGNEGAGNGKTEEVEAENPYGCNQHGHGWVDACPYGGGGSNGLAGKSALQIAGGAENVNPDDDEEKKKKKEAEAKAAAEAKAKEEAKQVVAEADEREKKWAELSDFYKKKLEEMSALKGTKEYEKAQAALKTIDWYKGGFAHWKEKLANGTEYERAAALDSLRRISNAERDAAQMQAYEKKAKTAFNKLEKFMKTFSDKKEAPVKKGKKIKTPEPTKRTPVADIESAVVSLPSEQEAKYECARQAEGKGGTVYLWNNVFSNSQQQNLVQYTDGYYEQFNYDFRHGNETEETRMMRSIFNKASLPHEAIVSRGEAFGGTVEYSEEFANLQEAYDFDRISREEGMQKVYEHLKARLERGEDIIRNSAAPTSTTAQQNAGFNGAIQRLIHIPKGARALSVAPVSYHEYASTDPGRKIDIEHYKKESKFGEREILIGPGAKFRTLGVQLSGGFLYIEEELILE